jgi:16S rRNA (cytidine1402-2'-O)-methyltransferase
MKQRSYDGSSILYVVPTPIGNMEDITIRSLNVLKEAKVIFSEDTRETFSLLKYYNLEGKKLISSHKFNENENLAKLIRELETNDIVALVSDRGTPLISDPGYSLIREAINRNFNVVCLPGATAFVPAMVMSGLSTDRFMFYGFLNSKISKQKKELELLSDYKYPIIFYEAPHRIMETLKNIELVFGDRKVAIVREISKKYEEIIRDNISNILKEVDGIKGEIVLIVEGNDKEDDYSSLSIIEHVNMFIEEGNSSKEAIKLVAKARNLPKSEVYGRYHRK